jgi:hypothetical protein
MTETQARIARGRRVKLTVGGHLGNVTGVTATHFEVTFDSVSLTEGGRPRRRSGGRYWYRTATSASRFEVLS